MDSEQRAARGQKAKESTVSTQVVAAYCERTERDGHLNESECARLVSLDTARPRAVSRDSRAINATRQIFRCRGA